MTYIEIDRCATDAIGVVTGCRLGKRALKFRDWGKMAATFVDLASGRAIRIVALESSKQRARELYPEIADKNQQQMKAYREMDDAELFGEQWVEVEVGPKEMPGYKGERVACDACGEGINYDRFVERDDETLVPRMRASGAAVLPAGASEDKAQDRSGAPHRDASAREQRAGPRPAFTIAKPVVTWSAGT